MKRRGKPDPLGHQAALALGGGRLALGAAAVVATRPALRAIGYPETGATGWSLAKVLGARDVAIGTLILAVRDDPATLRAVTLTAATLDAGDAVAFGFAAANPATRRAGVVGVASAVAGAAAGLWAWHRLRPA
jgi:hypothetical protein